MEMLPYSASVLSFCMYFLKMQREGVGDWCKGLQFTIDARVHRGGTKKTKTNVSTSNVIIATQSY